MLKLLSSELFRLRKRSQSWLLLIIAAGLIALIYGGTTIAALLTSGTESENLRDQVTFAHYADFGIAISIGFFGAVMLIIIAAGMMGNEFSWNTLRPLVARATSRSSLLTAKLIAMLIYAIVFVLVLSLIVAAMYVVGPMVVGRPIGFTMQELGNGLEYAYRTLYAVLPYLALAFMLATVFRSNAAGIAGALGINFIEGPVFALLGFASSFFDRVAEWGIIYNVQEFAAGPNAAYDARPAIILAVYTAIFVAIAYAVFLRRDVTSG